MSYLDGALCFALHRARLAVMESLHRAFEEHQITTMEFLVLAAVADSPRVSQADLAEALEVERPRMVPTLNKLEKRGLARRVAFTTDGRVRLIELTDKGHQLLKVLKRRADKHHEAMFERLDASERRAVFSTLWKLAGRH